MLLPSIRMVGNLRFLTDGSGSVTLPILVSRRGSELSRCFVSVGVDKTPCVLFAHQKSSTSGDVVGSLFWVRLSPWQTPSQLPVFHAHSTRRHDGM